MDNDKFWSALGQDPQRLRLTFMDEEYGIIPNMQQISEINRSPSLLDRLVTPESLVDPSSPTSETMPIYKDSILQRTMDNMTKVERPKQSPYLELSGLLDDIITTKRAALEEPFADSGSILKTKG